MISARWVNDKAGRIEDAATDLQSALSDLGEETWNDEIATLAGIICNAIDLREASDEQIKLLPSEYAKAAYSEAFLKWIKNEATTTLPPGMSELGKALTAIGISVEQVQRDTIRFYFNGE